MSFTGQFSSRSLARVSRGIRRIGRIVRGASSAAPVPVRDYYSIAIYTGASPHELTPATGASCPALTGKDVTDVAAAYVADPFMLHVNDCWYLYFEIMRKDVVKGMIGLATSRDGIAWEYQQVVLEEPFHLSYPCVFESDGDYFMIPESNQAGAVRLYRAVNFPTQWSFVGNLLKNVQYVDCTPFHLDGKWWMFAGCGTLPLLADTLRLFHADTLTGPWSEHPASPVVSNNPHIARPGGRVITWQNRLFRFTQDCAPRYGMRIQAFEITELTATSYRETAAANGPILKGSPHGWNSAGMHHLDCHPTAGGGCIACVDGWYLGPVET